MCLITIANNKRPTLKEMEQATQSNGDGIGIAWRESGKVRYLKGIDKPERAFKFCAHLPMPFVIHYRWASVGSKAPGLCHPFPLTQNVELTTKGTVQSVLFHNGHMGHWKENLASLACARNEGLPKGEWSDTRAVTWIVARLGETYLEVMDGKWVFFSKDKCTMYGQGWDEDGKGDMFHSNLTWKWKQQSHAGYGWQNQTKGEGCGPTVSSGKLLGPGIKSNGFENKSKESRKRSDEVKAEWEKRQADKENGVGDFEGWDREGGRFPFCV